MQKNYKRDINAMQLVKPGNGTCGPTPHKPSKNGVYITEPSMPKKHQYNQAQSIFALDTDTDPSSRFIVRKALQPT